MMQSAELRTRCLTDNLADVLGLKTENRKL